MLGVPKGSDRAAIRRGYAAKLRVTNPEDDPEGFKRLRKAYEWALQIASHNWQEAEILAVHDVTDVEIVNEDNDSEVGARIEAGAPRPEPADPEADELDALVAGLDAQLASPWRNDARSQNLFGQILVHPGMDRLDDRTRTEFRIGQLIADHVPASDAFLLDAIKAFEWDRVGRAEQWPFVAALERYEDWKLIAAFERPGHAYYRAWRALTQAPAHRWSRQLLVYSHHAPRIADLLDIIDYQSQGLLPSTLSAEVAWWRSRVGQGTFAFVSYAWALGVGISVWGLTTLLGLSQYWAVALGIANTASVAFDRYGIERGYQRLGVWWRGQSKGRQWRWHALMNGWPMAMAVLPFLVLLLPATNWSAGLVIVLCVAALLGLRLSGESQLTPFSSLWSAAALLIVVLALAVGGQLAPSLPRLAMLAAVGALFTQPLIAVRPILLELADARSRNHGAFLFLAYAIALAGVAFWASNDRITAFALVPLCLWVLSPLIASSPLMLANIAARVVRGGALVMIFLLAGVGNPLSIGPGMTNGEAIVALHLGLVGEPPLPETATALAEMRRRNPDLYRRIQRELLLPPHDNAAIDRGAMAIDELIDRAVPALIPVTSAPLAARYQRAKIDVLYAVRKTDAAKCADGVLTFSPDLDMTARHDISSALLAIAAHGPAVASNSRTADLPRKADFDATVDTLWPTVDAMKIQHGVPDSIRDRCTDRIATAQALADLPDKAIAAVLSLRPPAAP